jgi:hypothetical protein
MSPRESESEKREAKRESLSVIVSRSNDRQCINVASHESLTLEVRLNCIDESRSFFLNFPARLFGAYCSQRLLRSGDIATDTYAYVCHMCSTTIVSTILLIVIKLQLQYRKYFIRVRLTAAICCCALVFHDDERTARLPDD